MEKMTEQIMIRKLNETDLEQVNEMQEYRGLAKINTSFFSSSANDWVIYGAFDGEHLVSVSFLFPYRRIPNEDCPYEYVAELGGAYTLPEYRNKGIASKVIETMLNNVKNDLPLLDVILANTTDASHSLYKKFGFEDEDSRRIWKKP